MPKRALAVAAASLLPLSLLAAPSAQAAPSCNISTPSKVAITQPYRAIKATFSSGCLSYAETASRDLMHPRYGYTGSFWFDGGSTDVYDFYDWEPVGVYSVRPDGAYDYDWDELAQNTRTMTIKYGSRQYISSSRSGSTVTIAGTTTRYSPGPGPTPPCRASGCTCSPGPAPPARGSPSRRPRPTGTARSPSSAPRRPLATGD